MNRLCNVILRCVREVICIAKDQFRNIENFLLFTATLSVYGCFIPQIILLYETKSVENISPPMFYMSAYSQNVSILIFGVFRKDSRYIVTHVAMLIPLLVVIGQVIYYKYLYF